jgi:hypothetical protein
MSGTKPSGLQQDYLGSGQCGRQLASHSQLSLNLSCSEAIEGSDLVPLA